MNANIMNTQIFHLIKYNLIGISLYKVFLISPHFQANQLSWYLFKSNRMAHGYYSFSNKVKEKEQ